jgi:hypothetical protein
MACLIRFRESGGGQPAAPTPHDPAEPQSMGSIGGERLQHDVEDKRKKGAVVEE